MPAQWRDLLAELAPVFARRSTHRLFMALACGLILADRGTVTGMAAAAELANAACAPSTLDILARFSTLSRMKPHENSNLYSKMRVYDGESLKDTDPRAKSVQEYRDAPGSTRAWTGSRHALPSRCCRALSISTRRKWPPIQSI